MSTRALVSFSTPPRRGEVVFVRTLVQHPMETGQRADGAGGRVPRDIVRRVEARLDGELVFAADLHAAVAANPYLVFPLRAERAGTLVVTWAGDRGFAHREQLAFEPA